MNKKRIISGICAIGLSVMMMGCGSSASANAPKGEWKEVKTIDIKQRNYIGGFYDENYGVTVGYAGTVYYTNDGGDNWNQANNTSMCRFGLEMVDENVGYNSGNGGNVRRTDDGGKNWTEVTDFGESEPRQCKFISFIDTDTGLIGSNYMVGYTTDGGQNWEEIQLPDDVSEINSLQLVSKEKAYLIDTNKKLYITEDLGKTWTSKDIDIEDFPTYTFLTNGVYLRFTDDNNAIMFYASSNKSVAKCCYTTDGGDTWVQKDMPEVEATNGFYLSEDGTLLSINTKLGKQMTLLKLQ